jgi:hypothetical protein
MQPRPSFSRELWIPIAIATVSILGLGWILLTNDLSESLTPPPVEPTPIPLDVDSLKTAVWTPPPSVTPTMNETPPAASETTPTGDSDSAVETLSSASTLTLESRPVASATLRPDQSLPVGKHDDTDPGITYDRHWAFHSNSGTVYAYKGTLHVSSGIGSEASFHFTGQGFHLGYQRGRSFGIVTVMIDGEPYSFHQQAFGNVWRSPELSPGTHSVQLIHESGESVNLDYIEVLD